MIRTADIDEEMKDHISSKLYEVRAIRFGEFTLTSGKTSPYYVDLRLVPSYPELFQKFTDICVGMMRDIDEGVDRVVGVPTGGLPLGALVSQRTSLPLLYARKGKKSHGRKKGLEGVLEEGDRILIVDDVSTTGGSIQDTAETIRDGGGVVEHAMVLLDREEGASDSLEEEGVQLHACLKVSDLIDSLKEQSLLDEEKYFLVKEYIEGDS